MSITNGLKDGVLGEFTCACGEEVHLSKIDDKILVSTHSFGKFPTDKVKEAEELIQSHVSKHSPDGEITVQLADNCFCLESTLSIDEEISEEDDVARLNELGQKLKTVFDSADDFWRFYRMNT